MEPPSTEKAKRYITFTVRVKPVDLSRFNQILKIAEVNSIQDLANQLLDGTRFISKKNLNEEEQIDTMISHMQSNGTMVQESTGQLAQGFYMNVDEQDMFNFLKDVQGYKDDKQARDLVSYFRRNRVEFFTKALELKKSYVDKPKTRNWIAYAMRKFAEYYDWKFQLGGRTLELVNTIIRTYRFTEGSTGTQTIMFKEPGLLQKRIQQLKSLKGDWKFLAIKDFGLFTGFRQEEYLYCHKTPVCAIEGCDGKSGHRSGSKMLHVTPVETHPSLVAVSVNYCRGQKNCYWTILPRKTWNDFKNLPELDDSILNIVKLYLKANVGCGLMELRKYHFNVFVWGNTGKIENAKEVANVLQGRVKDVTAWSYAMYQLDGVADMYLDAWKKFGIAIQ